jgi:ectoine hydroxylase-related dioxygenase (phytanoyl-CoA dioxygenase family)
MAYRVKEFQDFFLERYVSMPLDMGDGLFFNPALFHAAGRNDSVDVMRSANLLQISSAFGKPMESIDSLPLVQKCWEGLVEKFGREAMSDEVVALIGNLAEGYPFPTNLDRRVPDKDGMAPGSEQDVLRGGLEGGWGVEKVLGEMERMREDSRA